MAKVKQNFITSTLDSWQEVQRFASAITTDLISQVNGNLLFGDNIQSAGPYTLTFSSSSDIKTISHTLGKVPSGILEIYKSSAIITYAPSGNNYAWTSANVYLQSNGAGTVKLYLIP